MISMRRKSSIKLVKESCKCKDSFEKEGASLPWKMNSNEILLFLHVIPFPIPGPNKKRILFHSSIITSIYIELKILEDIYRKWMK